MVIGFRVGLGFIGVNSRAMRVTAYERQLQAPHQTAVAEADALRLFAGLCLAAGAAPSAREITIRVPGCLPAAIDMIQLGPLHERGIRLTRSGDTVSVGLGEVARRRLQVWWLGIGRGMERLADVSVAYCFGLRVVTHLGGGDIDVDALCCGEFSRRQAVAELQAVYGLIHAGGEGRHHFYYPPRGRTLWITTRSARSE